MFVQKIPVNLTIRQLEKIVEEAKKNQNNHHYADDIITLHVEPAYIQVTQHVQNEEFGEYQHKEIFEKPINTVYVK